MLLNLSASHFNMALDYWLALPWSGGERRFPHNIRPGANALDANSLEWTEAKWEEWPWNPPPGYPLPDEGAPSKPPFSKLYGYALLLVKQDIVEDFRVWTRSQICEHIFGAHDVIDELFNHQEDNYTQEQLSDRDAVVTVHNAQRDIINALTDIDAIFTTYPSAQSAVTDKINELV